jgi:hypothetical protein
MDNHPLNFINIPTLDQIFKNFKEKYQIIYNRPQMTQIVADNSEVLDLNEFQWMKKTYPEVILMSDLYRMHEGKVNNFNHLQLLVYSNCMHFLSVHGARQP